MQWSLQPVYYTTEEMHPHFEKNQEGEGGREERHEENGDVSGLNKECNLRNATDTVRIVTQLLSRALFTNHSSGPCLVEVSPFSGIEMHIVSDCYFPTFRQHN